MLTRLRVGPKSLVFPTWIIWFPRLAAAAALFVAVALNTLPAIDGDRYHYGHIDNILLIYTMEWARYALFTEPQRYFEGLLYFGMGDSAFYTHLLLGGLPIYAPVAAIFGPATGINVLTIASPILNAVAATAAAWILLGRWWPSVIAGFIFAYTPIQQEFFQFHHTFMFWWTPLAMMLWFWFLRRPAWWKVSGAWLCVFIQLATGIYLGFIALVTLLALILAAWLSGRLAHIDRRFIVKAAAGTLVAALPFMPLLAGYVGFWLDNQEVRTLEEARGLSAGLPTYIPSAVRSQLWFQTAASNIRGLAPAFPAIVPAVLAALGLTAGLAARSRLRALTVALGITGLLMFALSLGPELWWNEERTGWGLPYATAHALIPGFASMRSPEIFAVGMVLAMAFLAAIAVDRFCGWRRISGWGGHLMIVVLLCLLIAEFVRTPVSISQIDYDQDIQAALAKTPDGPVAFLPGSAAGFLAQEEGIRRAWWSLNGSRQPVISGYSGYQPRGSAYLAHLTNWADASDRRQVLDALMAFGVRTIVLDRLFLAFDQATAWQATIQSIRPSPPIHKSERFVVSYLGPEGVPAVAAWSDVEIRPVLLETVPPSFDMVMPITIRNLADRPWRPPPGRRTRAGELVWEPLDDGTARRQSVRLRIPPIIPAGATTQVLELLTTVTPASPGQYRLRLSVEGTHLAAADIEIRAQPSVGSVPLRAADLRILTLPSCVQFGDFTRIQVEAINSGTQAWGPAHQLGARWSTRDDRLVAQPLDQLEARVRTPHDVRNPPLSSIGTGSGLVYEGSIQVPSAPGLYTLTLGMVDEQMSWFGEIEVPLIVVGASDRAAC